MLTHRTNRMRFIRREPRTHPESWMRRWIPNFVGTLHYGSSPYWDTKAPDCPLSRPPISDWTSKKAVYSWFRQRATCPLPKEDERKRVRQCLQMRETLEALRDLILSKPDDPVLDDDDGQEAAALWLTAAKSVTAAIGACTLPTPEPDAAPICHLELREEFGLWTIMDWRTFLSFTTEFYPEVIGGGPTPVHRRSSGTTPAHLNPAALRSLGTNVPALIPPIVASPSVMSGAMPPPLIPPPKKKRRTQDNTIPPSFENENAILSTTTSAVATSSTAAPPAPPAQTQPSATTAPPTTTTPTTTTSHSQSQLAAVKCIHFPFSSLYLPSP